MEKNKLKELLEVLNKMSVMYPETTQFIQKNMKEVYEREKLVVKEVFYFCCFS